MTQTQTVFQENKLSEVKLATFARDRAIILQILHKESRKQGERFRGLTYGEIRHWYQVREGVFKDLGNRIRELRNDYSPPLVETVKGEDGYLHVYPKETRPT